MNKKTHNTRTTTFTTPNITDGHEHVREFNNNIPDKVLYHPSITFVQIKVYAIIRSFMDSNKLAYCSNNWIAKKCNVERNAVIVAINALIQFGFVKKETIDGQRYLSIIIAQMIVTELPSIPKNTPPRIPKNTPPSIPKNTQLDQRINRSNTTTTCSGSFLEKALKQKTIKDSRPDDEFIAHVGHHVTHNNDKTKSLYQRQQMILKLLTELHRADECFHSKGFISGAQKQKQKQNKVLVEYVEYCKRFINDRDILNHVWLKDLEPLTIDNWKAREGIN